MAQSDRFRRPTLRGLSYRYGLLLLMMVTNVFGCAANTATDPLLTGNHMAIVAGQPVFLLGLYENPEEDKYLAEAVAAGFNVIRSGATAEALDRLHAHGVRAWINLGNSLDLSEQMDQRREALLKTVNALKDHPALLVWEGPDELLWNCWYSRTTYFGSVELPQMSRVTDAVRNEGKRAELRAILQRCQDCFGRALWAEFDAARVAFWEALGQAVPKPEITMARAVERARLAGAGLTAGFTTVREADSDHILWLNHAPRNSVASMRHHNRAVDMAGCDIYPIPGEHPIGHSDLNISGPAAVGVYTLRMRESAPGKGVVMVLQGFGWADFTKRLAEQESKAGVGIGRKPNWPETRFMAYDAIVNGANAIMYWGTSYIDKDGPLWKDLLRLARELNALQPALVGPSIEGPQAVADECFSSVDAQGPLVMLKRVDDDYVLIAVNEHRTPVSFAVRGLPCALEGRQLYRLENEESHAVNDGGFHDGMHPHSVHVYATSKRFAPRS